ncbi:hypothetical protein BgiMline_022133 [Biomphalaria glabrata]|nr:hypothetical protein BgiMline_010005 [Biomphalaria glabrata]
MSESCYLIPTDTSQLSRHSQRSRKRNKSIKIIKSAFLMRARCASRASRNRCQLALKSPSAKSALNRTGKKWRMGAGSGGAAPTTLFGVHLSQDQLAHVHITARLTTSAISAHRLPSLTESKKNNSSRSDLYLFVCSYNCIGVVFPRFHATRHTK